MLYVHTNEQEPVYKGDAAGHNFKGSAFIAGLPDGTPQLYFYVTGDGDGSVSEVQAVMYALVQQLNATDVLNGASYSNEI